MEGRVDEPKDAVQGCVLRYGIRNRRVREGLRRLRYARVSRHSVRKHSSGSDFVLQPLRCIGPAGRGVVRWTLIVVLVTNLLLLTVRELLISPPVLCRAVEASSAQSSALHPGRQRWLAAERTIAGPGRSYGGIDAWGADLGYKGISFFHKEAMPGDFRCEFFLNVRFRRRHLCRAHLSGVKCLIGQMGRFVALTKPRYQQYSALSAQSMGWALLWLLRARPIPSGHSVNVRPGVGESIPPPTP